MIKIRLARGGRVHKPVYTIVATDSRCPRDGRFLERLGQYCPNAPQELVNLKTESIAKWVKSGAEYSDTIKSLFKKHNVEIKFN